MDSYPVQELMVCEDKHYVCWECLEGYLGSCNREDREPNSVNSDGSVKCCFPCQKHYDIFAVSKMPGVPKSIVELLIQIRQSTAVKKSNRELEHTLRNQFEADRKRIAAIQDLKKREAETLRMDIVEEILTLRCPRCHFPFDDFDGCFAIKCGQPNCASFCGWCLQDCGPDAHAHVAVCPWGKQENGYFGPKHQFHEVQNARRVRLIKAKLVPVSQEVKIILYDILKKDLETLIIPIRIADIQR